MQITRLKVSDYKCLKDFSIDFTTDYEKGYSRTVLIGENGSGKSSIIEAITMILMSYDSESVARQVDFSYELEYVFGGRFFKLSHNVESGIYRVVVKEGRNIVFNRPHISFNSLKRHLDRQGIRLFPLNIITYYSGSDERLNRLNRQREVYYVKRIHDYIESHTYFLAFGQAEEPFPYKKYWYYTQRLSAPILFAMLLSNQNDVKRITKKLNISGIESFQIQIDTKSTLKYTGEEITKIPSENADYLFEVLDSLDIHITRRLERCRTIVTSNSIIFRLDDFSEWFMDSYAILDFFDKLSLIFNANYRLRVYIGQTPVDLLDLSEGQRQLINTLGLLTICKEQDSLVLMDEPDVYLNPRWKYEYLSYLEYSIQGATNTQILISTHDPLMINGLEKDFIRKLELKRVANSYKSVVYYPIEETRGLGIDGLLQSGYYGLKTSYDSDTSQKYEKRAELFSKLINERLTPDEELELNDLTKELNGLPAMNMSIDYLYDDFMREYRQSKYYYKEYLTSKQVEDKNKRIAKIIEELFKDKE